jgi:signal transduction histidine kinase
LGLAIVSAIANDHGGTVRMRDNTPRGTVFEMEFPARPPAKGKTGSTTPVLDDARRGI